MPRTLPLLVLIPLLVTCAETFGQIDMMTGLSQSMEKLTRETAPAVVKILATSYTPNDEEEGGPSLLSKQRSVGSGVIVDPEGYIVTNMHVVEGARRVRVILSLAVDNTADYQSILQPKGKTVDAQIVGMDRETDIAVLKINEVNLPYLKFGDSELLKKGQLVLAIGSPLGLDNSVSMGVISSLARQLTPEDPMVYIQTDASINPGNSGGPLINTAGEVVGINTLIFSQSGGSEGIGFAAPSNIVSHVFGQIRVQGYVHRGEIGVNTQTVTPLLAAGLALPQDWGVLLGDVTPGGPAHTVGLRDGDLVLTLDGKVMENGRQFDVNIYQHAVGDAVIVEVLRNGQKMTFKVPVTNRPYDSSRLNEMVDPKKNLVPKLGILGLDLNEKILKYLPSLRKKAGVVVAYSSSYNPSAEGGLKSGDVIYSVNRYPVIDLVALKTKIEALNPGDPLVLQIERFGKLMYISFELD